MGRGRRAKVVPPRNWQRPIDSGGSYLSLTPLINLKVGKREIETPPARCVATSQNVTTPPFRASLSPSRGAGEQAYPILNPDIDGSGFAFCSLIPRTSAMF
jgi:hypothetical protein